MQGATPKDKDFKHSLCADLDGFSLHAAVRSDANDRQALEQLCPYITRPALANERVQTDAAGQVVRKLKTTWLDGTAYLVMSPLEFMKQQIDGRLCRIGFCEGYASSGSIGTRRARRVPIDPYLPAISPQSGRTASHRFSRFASLKRPLVTSHTRPEAATCD